MSMVITVTTEYHVQALTLQDGSEFTVHWGSGLRNTLHGDQCFIAVDNPPEQRNSFGYTGASVRK